MLMLRVGFLASAVMVAACGPADPERTARLARLDSLGLQFPRGYLERTLATRAAEARHYIALADSLRARAPHRQRAEEIVWQDSVAQRLTFSVRAVPASFLTLLDGEVQNPGPLDLGTVRVRLIGAAGDTTSATLRRIEVGMRNRVTERVGLSHGPARVEVLDVDTASRWP